MKLLTASHFGAKKFSLHQKVGFFFPSSRLLSTEPPNQTIEGLKMRKRNGKIKAKKTPTTPEKNHHQQQQYWLLKTEPGEWSWDDQSSNAGITKWDGVKNKQAQNNLKSMRLDDLCFFYHSGATARRVVGVVKVVREWYHSEDGGDGMVDVKAVGEMNRVVDLKEMKGDDGLVGFALFRQPRLSVVAVPEQFWSRICDLGGGYESPTEEGNDLDVLQ